MVTVCCEDVTYTIEHSLSLFCADNIDYTYSPTTYKFGPTDDNDPIPSLVIQIPINDDDNNELNENFKLTLEVSAEGPISTTVVLIKDDDSKTKAVQYYCLLRLMTVRLWQNAILAIQFSNSAYLGYVVVNNHIILYNKIDTTEVHASEIIHRYLHLCLSCI